MTYTGLLLKKRPPEAWLAGSGKASERFGGTDLKPDGKWTNYIPPFEPQSRPEFDPQSCALEHTTRAWITLARFLGFNDFLPDGSERYLGVFAGTGPNGTDPYEVSDVARRVCGLIPQEEMPWTSQVTFDSYYDKTVAQPLYPFGKALLDRFDLGHQDLWAYGAKLSPEDKAAIIDTYLKRGTICVSISGDYRFNGGKLYKDAGERDTHWVQLAEKNVISDSYEPQFKKLTSLYDHEMATVYFLQRKATPTSNFWSRLWDVFIKIWASKVPLQTPPEAQNAPPSVPLPEPNKVPMPDPLTTLLPWTTQKNYFHNVRVLCDRAGLTYEQKEIVCGCIWIESRFRDYYSDGTPVKNANKDKTGAVWSTDWGLVQINDWPKFKHIGVGCMFSTVQDVLTHPERSSGYMISTMKSTGRLQPWASYTSGEYKTALLPTSGMQALRN